MSRYNTINFEKHKIIIIIDNNNNIIQGKPLLKT